MSTALSFFCGKGGVGKTTLSLAFGLLQARGGNRVLVVTSHPLKELALSISLDGLEETDPIAAANLFTLYIDPKKAINKKVQDQILTSILAKAVLSNKIYQSLIEVAPGLKEFAFLARLKELADGKDGAETPTYQRIIWDAPATGHFLETLRVAQNFEEYLSGPLAVQGKEVSRFLTESRPEIFAVTTLEEMAVEETAELYTELSRKLDLLPRGLIGNMVSPLLVASQDSLEEVLPEEGLADEKDSDLQRILERCRLERDQLEHLRSEVFVEFFLIERVRNWSSSVELLAAVANQLEAVLPAS